MSDVAVLGRLAHRWVVSVGCDERSVGIGAVGSSLGGGGVGGGQVEAVLLWLAM
jgi:hypothetical protein